MRRMAVFVVPRWPDDERNLSAERAKRVRLESVSDIYGRSWSHGNPLGRSRWWHRWAGRRRDSWERRSDHLWVCSWWRRCRGARRNDGESEAKEASHERTIRRTVSGDPRGSARPRPRVNSQVGGGCLTSFTALRTGDRRRLEAHGARRLPFAATNAFAFHGRAPSTRSDAAPPSVTTWTAGSLRRLTARHHPYVSHIRTVR